MIEATLTLKDGQSRAVRVPAGRDFELMLHFMRVPADGAGKIFRFQAPAGDLIDVPADGIASLEIPPPHALIPDFLNDDELAKVLAFALSHAETFKTSGVHEAPGAGASPTGYRIRRSRVLEGAANGPMAALMMPKLQALMPTVWPMLRLNPQPLRLLECEVTAHGDGDFFAVHTDNGMPEIAHRIISYVLYFHRDDPKQFSGGHLNLFHTLFEDGVQKCGRLATAIAPPRNGLMVFPTFVFHEVSPIQCASRALTDQRLTLNGWLF